MARVSLQLLASLAVLAAPGLVDAAAAALPFVNAGGPEASLPDGATWSAQVGNKVFYHDSSHDPSHYFYAAGRESALTEFLQERRVGSDGRWHVFHLPEGPAALAEQLPGPSSGSRHTAFSSLLQLQAGQVLPAVFPPYDLNVDYQQPGSAGAHSLEREALAKLTPALFNATLLEVTSIEDGASCTRSHTNQNATAHAIGFLAKQFKDLGLRTCLQWFGEYTNVIAFMPGTTRDTLTVGAHYDSRPYDGPAPGANDNGSGVAGLLTLARLFTEARVKPKRDVFFVAFAAEEPGLLGSTAYVKALRGETGAEALPADCRPPAASFLQAARKDVKHAALILDEVGWKSPFHPGEVPHMQLESRDGSNEVMTHVAQANKLYNGDSKLVVTHSTNPFGSDHMPFIDRKLEGVLVINGDDDRYPSYHSSGDVMANVDPEYASALLKAVGGGLFRLAGSADAEV